MTGFTTFPVDGIGYDDTILAGVGVGLTDGIGYNDTILAGVGVGLADGIGYDDIILAGVGVGLIDGIGYDDTILVGVSVGLIDGIGYNDVITFTSGVGLVDGIGFNDVLAALTKYGVALEDGIGFSDGSLVGLGVFLDDGIGFSDSIDAKMSYLSFLTDGIGYRDVIALKLSLFPRTIGPMSVSDLWLPGALKDMGISGLLQLRATKQVGWSWEEIWPPLSVRDGDHQGLMAFLAESWNRGTIFEVTHALTPGSGLSPNGLGSSGVTVSGGSQTGEELITAGWPTSTADVSRAGDVIKIIGDDAVYMVTTDVDSDAGGLATLILNPPLRSSPVGGSQIVTSGVLFRATLSQYVSPGTSRAPFYFEGVSATMTEALSP